MGTAVEERIEERASEVSVIFDVKETTESGLGRPFWRLFSAATVSNMGDGLSLVAFPLAAASLTEHPGLIAGVVVALQLPWLLFGLISGTLADRVNRARCMAFVDLGRMTVVMSIALASALGELTLPILYAGAFALGTLETLFAGASQAAIPGLVRDPQLERANGYLYASETGCADLAGPALGSFVFVAAAGLPFLLDGLSFFASALLLLGLAGRLPAPNRTEPTSIRADAREGLRFFVGHDVLRLLAGLIGTLAFCQAMVMAVLVVFATKELGLSAATYGLFLAGGAIGRVAGALNAHRVRALLGTRAVLLGSAILAGAVYPLIGTTSSVPLAMIGFALEAFAVGCGTVASLSLRQSLVPDELRGRVSNAFRMCIWGVIPIGALVGGLLAQFGGVRLPFVVAGIAQLTVVGLLGARLLSRLQATEREASPVVVLDTVAA